MKSLRLSKILLTASVVFCLCAGAVWAVPMPRDFLFSEEVQSGGAFSTGQVGGFYEQDVNGGWFLGSIGRGFRMRWMTADSGHSVFYKRPPVIVKLWHSWYSWNWHWPVKSNSPQTPQVPAEPAPVPEPMILVLMGTGLAGMIALGKRRMLR